MFCNMTDAIPTVEASEPTVNIAFELTSRRIKHGAEMSRNLRVSKAFKHASGSVTVCGWDFRSKSVSGAARSLK
jgi:hypothetical protein